MSLKTWSISLLYAGHSRTLEIIQRREILEGLHQSVPLQTAQSMNGLLDWISKALCFLPLTKKYVLNTQIR